MSDAYDPLTPPVNTHPDPVDPADQADDQPQPEQPYEPSDE